jgi:hypothetical protein
MSTSQWVSIVAAVLSGIGALASVWMGYATWGAELPTILAVLAVLGIHPNLPTS